VDGTARHEDSWYRWERHDLVINGQDKPPIGRSSLEHLVDFIDSGVDSHEVTASELLLYQVRLISDPSHDGGLNVLREFFARSDTMLTKVALQWCRFGSQEDTSRLLAAFQTNRIVSDLNIEIRTMEGDALEACLAGLLRNMPQLQRLSCYSNSAAA
jgi:hypothetical protein